MTQSPLRLGIDTGGTYTDAVLLDPDGDVVSTAKALTTHHELTKGIREAIDQLPGLRLSQVSLVSLSTTLATNAVVEGRGTPVCLLLAGYNARQVNRARLEQIVRGGHCALIPGGHDAGGNEREPLDLEGVRRTVIDQHDKVAAFGISGLFGVRNPDHEVRIRELVSSLTGKPVTCGHELASQLDAPRRALTVAFNASLIPYIDELIRAIKLILGERKIHAPVMMVKGDGSLISADTALARPVETILSGPAASVMGAAQLQPHQNAIIADMGGTTTDIAIVTDGRPVISAKATVIGTWRPMVEAIRVFSLGLGGDSEVRFQGGVGLAIGPRRVVPMSLLAHRYPEILRTLEQRMNTAISPRSNRFAVALFAEASQKNSFSSDEAAAWERLQDSPLDVETLSQNDRPLARALARLVRDGIAIYSGFTPTDAAHVLGKADHWSVQAAEFAAVTWAKQMRQVYGWGKFSEQDPKGPSAAVEEHVVHTICAALVSACLATDPGENHHAERERTARLFSDWISGKTAVDGGLFSLQLDATRSLVAVGAPAELYYPRVAQKFNVPLSVPQYSSVANAVGAVASSVVQRAEVTVTQPVQGIFRVFTPDGPVDFDDLEQALLKAEEVARRLAQEKARTAGAHEPRIHIDRNLNSVDDPDSASVVFFEGRVKATATGRPALTPTLAGVGLPNGVTGVKSRASQASDAS
ncbi:MAG TPA: hydantoinase/oxoprolinase family protein [Gammaproteobacteria bacterium]|nr:hydantoinase/oxoprolinase family protein [Gammaproteobacteria bacterium]